MNDEKNYLTLSDIGNLTAIDNLTAVLNPWGDAITIDHCPYTINDISDDLERCDKDSLGKTIQKAIVGALAENNALIAPNIEKYKIKHR